MKTKLIITTGCLMIATFTFGQNKQPSKAEIKAMKVENTVQSGRYEIYVNQVHPMGGAVRHLTSSYSVRVSGDSAYVYLPYFGRAYSAPYGGEGGINVTNVMDDYKLNKKKKNYSIDFKAKGANDVYRFSIDMSTNGSASIRVTCNNRQAISYLGDLIITED